MRNLISGTMVLVLLGGIAVWWLLAVNASTRVSRADRSGGIGGLNLPDYDELERRAEQSFFRGDYEQAASLYRSIVHEQDENSLAWARLAYATHELGRFEESLRLHERAAAFEENRATSYFKLACSLARLERIEEALSALERAVEYGYRDRSWAEQESDLQTLNDHERFARVLNRMAPAPEGRGELDFWVGHWILRDPNTGDPQGHSTILRVERGHLLTEQWSEYSGDSGRGMLYQDPNDGLWYLHRVDNRGQVQRLRGSMNDGVLNLSGELIQHSGRIISLKLTVDPNSRGQILQAAEISQDDGESWETLSEIRFHRDDPMGMGRGRY